MTLEENKALMRRIYDEFINAGNLAGLDDVIAADVIEHQAFPGAEPGLSGSKQILGMLLSAFPDLHMAVDYMIAEGDMVVAHVTLRGTHRGELQGIPATGKRVSVPGVDIVRVAGGKVVEHWGYQDDLGMLQQLGVAPAPGQGRR